MDLFIVHIYLFFPTSGPLLPIPLGSHSMVRLGNAQAILGGNSNNVYQSKIYLMTCSNWNCIISLLSRELSVARDDFVAIPIPDSISGCVTGGTIIFLFLNETSMLPNVCFTLDYRLPVSTTNWGWILSRLQQQSSLLF